MKAGDGVALPGAVIAAVAAVVPVVVATTEQTVNMAGAMVTVTFKKTKMVGSTWPPTCRRSPESNHGAFL